MEINLTSLSDILQSKEYFDFINMKLEDAKQSILNNGIPIGKININSVYGTLGSGNSTTRTYVAEFIVYYKNLKRKEKIERLFL